MKKDFAFEVVCKNNDINNIKLNIIDIKKINNYDWILIVNFEESVIIDRYLKYVLENEINNKNNNDLIYNHSYLKITIMNDNEEEKDVFINFKEYYQRLDLSIKEGKISFDEEYCYFEKVV